MPQPIVVLDTETTSLRPDRRAWEIAVIVIRPDQPDHKQSWLITSDDLDLGNADPKSLEFGGFYQRHPESNQQAEERTYAERYALVAVEQLTRGAVIAGSNPGFDMDVLGARMRANGICPSWHYHPLDVPTLAEGWLCGRGLPIPDPAKSDAISLAVGVDPEKYERHTAMGDCEWSRDLLAAVVGGQR